MYRDQKFYRALQLVPNIERAVIHNGEVDAFLPHPASPPRMKYKTVTKQCAECKRYKEMKSRAKFCSDDCRIKYNNKLYRKRKALDPARYQNLKAQKNAEWLDHLTKETFGYPTKPPVHKGRPTRVKLEALRRFKLNRLRNSQHGL